jgi:hypothetical protein
VSDKKQIQVEKGIDLLRPGKGDGQDTAQGEPTLPIGSDQGFVYYEE